MATILKALPYFTAGLVVKGFGRGSKQLGIPTANFPDDVVQKLPKEIDCGVYFGWAQVNDGDIHKMVMSIGWNPFYKNEKKSMETHIMHEFETDFYGSILKIGILGYLRPEKSFKDLDNLVAAIHKDVADAAQCLDDPVYSVHRSHSIFNSLSGDNDIITQIKKEAVY